jgi:hypothetical protein
LHQLELARVEAELEQLTQTLADLGLIIAWVRFVAEDLHGLFIPPPAVAALVAFGFAERPEPLVHSASQ